MFNNNEIWRKRIQTGVHAVKAPQLSPQTPTRSKDYSTTTTTWLADSNTRTELTDSNQHMQAQDVHESHLQAHGVQGFYESMARIELRNFNQAVWVQELQELTNCVRAYVSKEFYHGSKDSKRLKDF